VPLPRHREFSRGTRVVNRKQFTLLFTIVAVVTAYLFAGGEDMLNIRIYQARYQASPLVTSMVFFLVFLFGTALSLPVSGFLSVLAGFIFGSIVGFSEMKNPSGAHHR
jgi:uncharacterized membrane protein YdjX (TVP38/TMEM64 family)